MLPYFQFHRSFKHFHSKHIICRIYLIKNKRYFVTRVKIDKVIGYYKRLIVTFDVAYKKCKTIAK